MSDNEHQCKKKKNLPEQIFVLSTNGSVKYFIIRKKKRFAAVSQTLFRPAEERKSRLILFYPSLRQNVCVCVSKCADTDKSHMDV